MTQDLEHFMQQTQESMLMTTSETNVADKSEEGPVVQQPESIAEPGLDEIRLNPYIPVHNQPLHVFFHYCANLEYLITIN